MKIEDKSRREERWAYIEVQRAYMIYAMELAEVKRIPAGARRFPEEFYLVSGRSAGEGQYPLGLADFRDRDQAIREAQGHARTIGATFVDLTGEG